MTGRVGFCCIVLRPRETRNGVRLDTPDLFKFRTATVAHVSKLELTERVAYITNIVEHNVRALYEVVNALAQRPAGVRMFRITSGFWPLYTHESVRSIYADSLWMQSVEGALAHVGALAREHGVRLSFHPGQFCVLNSASEQVRLNSIEEFEYMARVATAMGYRGGADGFCCNVHGGAGWVNNTSYTSWDWSWSRLSAAAKRLITLENDEYSWSAAQILRLCERLSVRMVLDVHHEWVRRGVWLEPDGRAASRIRETWCGHRPKLHISLCDPALAGFDTPDAPCAVPPTGTLAQYNAPMFPRPATPPRNLRAHSGYIWYPGAIGYIHRWQRAGWDVQTEFKMKNLASFPVWRALQTLEGA